VQQVGIVTVVNFKQKVLRLFKEIVYFDTGHELGVQRVSDHFGLTELYVFAFVLLEEHGKTICFRALVHVGKALAREVKDKPLLKS